MTPSRLHRRPRLRVPAGGTVAVLAALLFGLLVALVAGGCAADGRTSPTRPPAARPRAQDPGVAAPRAPNVVPLAIGTGGQRLLADVEIGGARLTVIVDTGSSGLRVSASAVPPGAARVVGPATPNAYGTGTQFTGRVAEAGVGLGGEHSVATAIELVDSVGCAPGHPDCKAVDVAVPGTAGGRYDGILGVSPRSDPELGNPLWSFGPVGRTFALHVDPAGSSTLTLGAPPDGYATEPLTPIRPAPADASRPPSWTANTPVCFQAAVLAPPRVCTPTLFDSGTPALADIHVATGADQSPRPGFPVTLSTLDGRWAADYTTARGRSADVRVVPSPNGAPDTSVAGLPAFTRADVRYDLAGGTIGFRNH